MSGDKGLPRARVIGLLREAIPGLADGDLHCPFEELAVDSFALLTLRAEVEQALGAAIPDAVWTALATPADIVQLACRDAGERPGRLPEAAEESRVYRLGMPQMALGGLSESWLFKELGDIHWSLISHGLGVPASAIEDGNGHRLYATFTRIRVDSAAPLSHYAENEKIELTARAARYGAGLFFSNVDLCGAGRSLTAELMSIFSRRTADGSNASLLKGQPDIPAGCAIPVLDQLPPFARDYREQRAAQTAAAVFATEYHLIPGYDINGVGLLYCAAYPMIHDICIARHDRKAAWEFSTRRREVFYFGNAAINDSLVCRILVWRQTATSLEIEASLSRSSDGAAIAHIITTKDRVDG